MPRQLVIRGCAYCRVARFVCQLFAVAASLLSLPLLCQRHAADVCFCCCHLLIFALIFRQRVRRAVAFALLPLPR